MKSSLNVDIALFQGGGEEPRRAVERTVLVYVQDVCEREHRRFGASVAQGLRTERVQGSVQYAPFLLGYN